MTRIRFFSHFALTAAALLAAFQTATAQRGEADRSDVPRFLVAYHDDSHRMTVDADVTKIPLLRRLVSVNFRNTSLDRAIRAVASQARVSMVFASNETFKTKTLNVRMENVTLAAVLTEMLVGLGVDVLIDADRITLIPRASGSSVSRAASGTIAGHVVDATNKIAVPNATISIDAIGRRATSGNDGQYRLRDVPAGTHLLSVRRLGYALNRTRVEVGDGETVTKDFALDALPTHLTEVVTTATGERRRLELGNSIATINADSVVANTPVSTLSELIATRVPGATVQQVAGNPGAPSRIRIRGISTINGSNDPIVIVDGARVYAEVTSGLGVQQQGLINSMAKLPSRFDDLDPNSIESIEVLKGPSAAALYGSEAASGVIVVKTKQGQPGPPQWTFTAEHGVTYIPGKYPENSFAWASFANGAKSGPNNICLASGQVYSICTVDSVTHYSSLNDPDQSVLGHGSTDAFSARVSGGTASLQYFINGTTRDDVGLIKLPDFMQRYILARNGDKPIPGWQERPDRHKDNSVNGHFTWRIRPTSTVSLSSQLSRGVAQTTALSSAITAAITSRGVRDTIVPGTTQWYNRTVDGVTRITNSARADLRLAKWLSVTGVVGYDYATRAATSLIPRNTCLVSCFSDSTGSYSNNESSNVQKTINLTSTAEFPLTSRVKTRTSVGGQYTKSTQNLLSATATNLAFGVNGVSGAATRDVSENSIENATAGTYLEQWLILNDRLFLSGAIRRDAGTSLGRNVAPLYPKWGVAWFISQEPWLPRIPGLSTLRLRSAFGHSGILPSVTDKLRTYLQSQKFVEGSVTSTLDINTYGNAFVRPERSTELEAGFELGLLNDRVTVDYTGFRKTSLDAIITRNVAPSVNGGGTEKVNVGTVRNSGGELTVTAEPFALRGVTWSTIAGMSWVRNKLLKIGEQVKPFGVYSTPSTTGRSTEKIVEGYPLFGRWERPLIGFHDDNGDGILTPAELRMGDTAVYLGWPYPRYTLSLHNSISFFDNMVAIFGTMQYEDGMNQVNSALAGAAGNNTSRVQHDPRSASLAEQAVYLAAGPPTNSNYGMWQTVNTFRFESLSIRLALPARLTQAAGARRADVFIMGRNLGLWTNYRGKDPRVSGSIRGDQIFDSGVLPTPRVWTVRVSVDR